MDETLESILNGLYTGEEDPTPETKEADKTGEGAGEPASTPDPKAEEDMTDEEIALSVNVDLPEQTEDGSPASEQAKETPAEPPKKRTAEDAKKIREEAEADVKALRAAFPELKNLRGLGELKDSTKYLEYRKKGLTAEEAYTLSYASSKRKEMGAGVHKPDLRPSPSSGGTPSNGLTAKEAREVRAQTGLSEEEIRKYYRKF